MNVERIQLRRFMTSVSEIFLVTTVRVKVNYVNRSDLFIIMRPWSFPVFRTVCDCLFISTLQCISCRCEAVCMGIVHLSTY